MSSLKYKTNNGYEPLPAMVVRKTNAENGNGIGTCSTSSGTALAVSLTNYELVQNGFVAVTFENDVPANATLNVNGKGAKAIIYKGSAIDGDTIKADDTVMFGYDGTNYVLISSGGSGSVNLVEYLTVSLTSNQTNLNSDLIGATITITDTENSETLFTATWAGTDLEFEIPTGTAYQVSVSAVTGYTIPNATSHTAGLNKSRTDTFTYYTEVVTVTATTSNSAAVTGQKVTINGTEYTFDSTGIVSAKVPFGTSYSVVASSWSGTTTGGVYKKPSSQSFTAGQVSRSVSIVWTWVAEAVDLGLPSGNLWCSHNVGATNPEDEGLLFYWGDIVGHYIGYNFSQSDYESTQVNGTYIKDIRANLSLSYDAARANMGGEWRMPSTSDFEELLNNTTYENTTINNVRCTIVTSNTNGNTLILPWYFFSNRYFCTWTTNYAGIEKAFYAYHGTLANYRFEDSSYTPFNIRAVC